MDFDGSPEKLSKSVSVVCRKVLMVATFSSKKDMKSLAREKSVFVIKNCWFRGFVKELNRYSEDSTLVFSSIKDERVEVFNLKLGSFMPVVNGGGAKQFFCPLQGQGAS